MDSLSHENRREYKSKLKLKTAWLIIVVQLVLFRVFGWVCVQIFESKVVVVLGRARCHKVLQWVVRGVVVKNKLTNRYQLIGYTGCCRCVYVLMRVP